MQVTTTAFVILRLYFYGRKACLCSSARSGLLLLSLPCCITSASCLHASLLQSLDGVMFLALYLHVVSQAPQHFRSSETPPLMIVALPTSLSAQSFLFTPACPVQYVQKNFRRWMPTIDTCQSGLPIPFFTFCSKLIESPRIMACVF